MKKEKESKSSRLIPVEKEPNLIKAAFIAIKKGDWAVKLSTIVMGTGYWARRQFIKSILVTIYQIAMLAFIIMGCSKYLVDFGTLGTVARVEQINFDTMETEYNEYDNSFTILLFSVVTMCAIVAFIGSWLVNLRTVYKLQKLQEAGKHVNNFKEDFNSYINEKFHITLLTLPVLGVVIFTVVPLIILIAVAFTNYDINHITPKNLIDWVGFRNFKTIFGTGMTATFGYSFRKVLSWTLIWAFLQHFQTISLELCLQSSC